MTILAVDLGGTKLALALFSDDGEPGARSTLPIAGRRGRDVGTLIIDAVRALASRAEGGVDAIGVAVPGIYRAGRGTVWAPNIPGWEDYPLRDEMRAAFGADARVTIDSDRAAYIAGETWRGAARGGRNAIYLAVGTGIGAGILVDGRILRGARDIAGAIGWLALSRPFRGEYVDCGCFERHASGPGIAKCARALLDDDASYDGALRASAGDLTTADVLAAYDVRDPIATRVIDDAIAYWAMAAANLVSLFDPEIIVFGGGVFGPAARFLDRIRDEATRWAQPVAMRDVVFAVSSLGSDAGLYGAARLATQGVAAPPTSTMRA